MKRVCQFAGLLSSIFLLSFFLEYSCYGIFPQHIGSIFECDLDKGITSTELAEISSVHDITTFTTEYNNSSFYNAEIYFNFLNIRSDAPVSFGLQSTILPTMKVYYAGPSDAVTYIQRFWAIENNANNFQAFVDKLSENSLEYSQFYPVRLTMLDIFCPQNLYFLFCVFLLILFCNTVWFYKQKEHVSVLHVNAQNITRAIHFQLFLNIAIPYLLVCGVFGIYILFRNSPSIFDYLKAASTFFVVLFLIQRLGTLLASLINRLLISISSITVARHIVPFIIYFIFNISGLYLFISPLQNFHHDFENLTLMKSGEKLTQPFSPSYIVTSKIPDDTSMEFLFSILDDVGPENIYNYAHPTKRLLGYDTLHNTEANKETFLNPPNVRMSYNMLDYVPIIASDGARVNAANFDSSETTILVPEHLKKDVKTIQQKFYDGESFNVTFIQDNQVHFDILDPSYKVSNAMYILTPVEKDIYYTNGRVLFDSQTAVVVEAKLDEHGFDRGTISLTKLSDDYKSFEEGLRSSLISSGFFIIVNGLFYISTLSFGAHSFLAFKRISKGKKFPMK